MFDLFISIIVYGLTALTLYTLANRMAVIDGRYLKNYGRHSSIWTDNFFISIAVFAIVSGARYNTGADHLHYLVQYSAGGDMSMEPLFYMISHSLSEMGIHFFFYFALWASIQILFVYLAMKEHRETLPFIALAIMLGPYYLDWMNGIRQSLVECFYLYIVSFFAERKTKKTFLLCILLLLCSTTIHKSALMLIPLLFLQIIKNPFGNKWVDITIAIVCIIIGMSPYWISMNSEGVVEILSFLGYSHYSMIYEDIVEIADLKETAMGPLRILGLMVDFIIIWIYPKMKVFYNSDSKLSSFYLFFLLGVFTFNLFANTNLLFLRPIAYLTIFKLPMIGYTLAYLKGGGGANFRIVSIMVCSYAMIDVLKSSLLGIKEYNLYHFFILS